MPRLTSGGEAESAMQSPIIRLLRSIQSFSATINEPLCGLDIVEEKGRQAAFQLAVRKAGCPKVESDSSNGVNHLPDCNLYTGSTSQGLNTPQFCGAILKIRDRVTIDLALSGSVASRKS